jgi:hypothetical protein
VLKPHEPIPSKESGSLPQENLLLVNPEMHFLSIFTNIHSRLMRDIPPLFQLWGDSPPPPPHPLYETMFVMKVWILLENDHLLFQNGDSCNVHLKMTGKIFSVIFLLMSLNSQF